MEKLRRSLKIFWTEHGDPILVYSIIIVGVILIVQGLNWLTIQSNKKKEIDNINNNNTIMKDITAEDNKNNKQLINEFMGYCKNGQVEGAYNLLSENCKKELYPTLNDFTNKYYKIVFTRDYDTEVEYDSNNIYIITFYENMIETGKIENRDIIAEDRYKIESEIVEDKIYINCNKEIK